MVSLTFYGGVAEIGGNKILLEDGDTRVFLDFGMGFTSRGRFFEEFLTPRTANGIGDFLAMDLLPDIEGVYRNDLLKHYGRPTRDADIDAVFLSHAHADHANYISFLHEDIPIYCGVTAKLILEAVYEQSQRSIESEVLNYKKRPIYRRDYKKPPIQRSFKTFRSGDRIKVGSLEIHPIHVDHSVPGAYGFVIYSSEGAIVYTGDLRLHGSNPWMTRDFIDAACESRPVALVSEGTRINQWTDDASEQTVYNTSKGIVDSCRGLAIADFNFKDVDRFKTFYRISKESGRRMVLSFKHACFLERYASDEKLDVPGVSDENILLMKPKLGTGTYDDGDYANYRYIKDRLGYGNIVTADEIREKQKDYLIVLNYWSFNSLIDLEPIDGAYIHSLSEPFNEEMEIGFTRMMNWLNHFNLRFFQAHCSGHASGSDLKKIIEGINPKTVYPIHTEHPRMFRDVVKDSIEVCVVEKGGRYRV